MPIRGPGGLMFSHQWRRLSLLRMSVPFLTALGGACAGETPTEPHRSGTNIDATVVASKVTATLAGFAVLSDNGDELALAAFKYLDGRVVGFASGVTPGSLNGPVVELIPPHGAIDFWCANIAIANEPTLQGFNFLWYIRDVGNGLTQFDEWATNGSFGLTCAAAPVPPLPFVASVKGDFKSFTR